MIIIKANHRLSDIIAITIKPITTNETAKWLKNLSIAISILSDLSGL